jgi:hypothetical protein
MSDEQEREPIEKPMTVLPMGWSYDDLSRPTRAGAMAAVEKYRDIAHNCQRVDHYELDHARRRCEESYAALIAIIEALTEDTP